MSFPIRSPRHQTNGIFVFARILDKIRLNAEGKLPAGYHLGIIPGSHTFDERVCKFLNVDYDALSARTLAGGSDEEILAWAFETGGTPDAERIEVWNAFMNKRGWRDAASPGLEKSKAAAGFSEREEIQTFFDLMDAEEGHA